MKKTFCDICGTEIPRPDAMITSSRPFKGLTIKVELRVSPEKHDICQYCIVDIVKQLEQDK